MNASQMNSEPLRRGIPSMAWEIAGGVFILAMVVFYLAISWRKWPDPLVDFGRELYLPWRLSEGAVLYRDLDHWFGPLSQYFNAGIFRLTGPGLMHLVYANIALYLLMLALLYVLIRTAWGRVAAFMCSSAFVCVFSFSQIVRIGNYNYIAPYAHESTHGVLLLLALVASLTLWFRSGGLLNSALAGLLLGLCVLTKVEIIFSAGAVLVAAVVIALACRRALSAKWPWRHLLLTLFCAALVNVIAASALAIYDTVTWTQALRMANRAWLALIEHHEIVSNPLIRKWLGMDAPAQNLAGIGLWTFGAIAVVLVLSTASLLAARAPSPSARNTVACVVALAAIVIGLLPDWPNAGQALPGLLLVGALWGGFSWWRGGSKADVCRPAAVAAIFLWVLGCSMLARMALNPRLYHYGFYQAALAGMVCIAFLVAGVPRYMRLSGFAKHVYVTGVSLIVLLACVGITTVSSTILAQKTYTVGEGADRFYGFAPEVNARAKLLELTRRAVSRTPDVHTLLVAPEGVMLNYLVRVPSTVPDYVVYLPFLRGDSDRLMDQLQASPPSHVVLISRDLREYGIQQFGDSPEHGQSLVEFIGQNYKALARLAGDPLDPDQVGMLLFTRKTGKDAPATNPAAAAAGSNADDVGR